LIEEFKSKLDAFYDYVRTSSDGKRLIVKLKSYVSEDEIYADFARIYRKYKAVNRREVGEYFFKETADIIDKLCDDFKATVRASNGANGS
jgi:type I restriction enzyme, R subunit